MHLTWELAAKERGLKFIGFDSYEAFVSSSFEINKDTPINIDVNLGNGIKGTDVALKVSELGYFKIYLATGYEADSIQNIPNFIRGINGKEPFFPEDFNVN